MQRSLAGSRRASMGGGENWQPRVSCSKKHRLADHVILPSLLRVSNPPTKVVLKGVRQQVFWSLFLRNNGMIHWSYVFCQLALQLQGHRWCGLRVASRPIWHLRFTLHLRGCFFYMSARLLDERNRQKLSETHKHFQHLNLSCPNWRNGIHTIVFDCASK